MKRCWWCGEDAAAETVALTSLDEPVGVVLCRRCADAAPEVRRSWQDLADALASTDEADLPDWSW